MRRNPERVAWAVLLLAFSCFCVLVVGIPLGTRWYLRTAQRTEYAVVESIAGTVVVEPPIGVSAVPLSKGQTMTVPEGTVIRADETSEAVITFYDHSFMRLFKNSSVRLELMRQPRYKASTLPASIALTLLGGRVQIGTAISIERALEFQVSTLQGTSLLAADGSYALEASNDRCDVAAYRGQATVAAAGSEVRLNAPGRTIIELDQPPQAPTGVARNLIVDGDFSDPLEENWRAFNDQGSDGGDVNGEVEVVVDEGRRAVRFSRTGGQGDHCETILEQTLDYALPDPATSLVVQMMVKVRNQSLSGGGYLSSEYPLMIRITYRDAYDNENEWVQGFYYQNTDNNPTMYGLLIPHDRWYPFESENLLETLPVRPFRIMRVRIYASGWDYDSLVSDVNLIAE